MSALASVCTSIPVLGAIIRLSIDAGTFHVMAVRYGALHGAYAAPIDGSQEQSQ